MTGSVQRVVIVGGGTAGWLAAALLAARRPDLAVTLVESPDIPTIGVGEGTWPTMRETLASIGIAESEFLRECDASFKQGSRFDGWVDGSAGDSYLHPFSAPPQGDMRALLAAWQAAAPDTPFAAAMTPQAAACARDLAPRQRAMPDYAGALNYGYHLDAGKFAALLARHATERLGVTRIAAEVTGVVTAGNGDIAALDLRGHPALAGDLFLDCSGQAAILIGGPCDGGWIDRSDVSFNDRALAVQVPTLPDAPIAAQTVGTAHAAGWLWDIALPTRRGIGCVYAARFMDDDAARQVLFDYIRAHVPGADVDQLHPRQLTFRTGHRARFWDRNCLAVGLSAGFIEPLEASAIVLIELSLNALIENFPASRTAMTIHANRFNALFRYRWDRIVEFLKLHYALSRRTEPYWLAQRAPDTIPAQLAEQLVLWRDQPPSAWDFPRVAQDGEGTRLFDEDARPTPYLETMAGRLGDLDHGYRQYPAFFAALERHDLLEPFTLDVPLDNGARHSLVGYHVIAEERLAALDGGALGELQLEGHLLPIFMAVASLGRFADLVARKNARVALG